MDYSDNLIEQQIEYYRARAREYDEWFFRKGRYDRGPEHRTEWFNEIELVRNALDQTILGGDVLELACGTGLWTERLARANRTVVAVDASPEVLEINRERVKAGNVGYVVADLFSWRPPRQFDSVFFSFWLSHVPDDRFEAFWALVRFALKPEGMVFFVDSLLEQSSTAKDHATLDTTGIVQRKLNDGREFEIVKRFYEPAALERKLHGLGWRGSVHATGKFFLYGSMSTRSD
jgi:demethylmenaquinone methyltransferase/2-methoxy-6-polyprenyl-1,4-benzoquinol methylase